MHRRFGNIKFDAFNVVLCARGQLDEIEAAYIATLLPVNNHSLRKAATKMVYVNPSAADLAEKLD